MKLKQIIDPRLHFKEIEKLADLPNSVSLTGEFDENLAFSFRLALDQAETQALKSGQKILPIVIDSFGGDVYALNACMDAIKNISKELIVSTIVVGKAMSAGAALFTCGASGYRYMSESSTLMFHTASGGAEGTIADLEITVEEYKRLNSDLLKQCSKNLGKKDNFLEQMIKKNDNGDLYLDAKEALNAGIVDKIGIPGFTVKISYDIEFGLASSKK